jgi:hypothetical protein
VRILPSTSRRRRARRTSDLSAPSARQNSERVSLHSSNLDTAMWSRICPILVKYLRVWAQHLTSARSYCPAAGQASDLGIRSARGAWCRADGDGGIRQLLVDQQDLIEARSAHAEVARGLGAESLGLGSPSLGRLGRVGEAFDYAVDDGLQVLCRQLELNFHLPPLLGLRRVAKALTAWRVIRVNSLRHNKRPRLASARPAPPGRTSCGRRPRPYP